jgi:flagellar basal-body rod modification protein FlgD
MEIPGTSANDSFLSSASPIAKKELGRDSFLQLLVTQLENQDPLEPLQNEEFLAQLATFSQLEQLENLNGNVVSMMALNQSNALLSQLTEGSALIGKNVGWVDPTNGETGSGQVESVRIVEGLAVLVVGGREIPLAVIDQVEPSGDALGDEVSS